MNDYTRIAYLARIWLKNYFSWKSTRKVVTRIGSIKASLVLMVSVLDVLSQPVLGPVDGLTVDGSSHVVQEDKELVVLHLVVNTVEVLHSTESSLLKVKMQLHVFLQFVQGSLTVRDLGDLKDVGEEDIVFGINTRVL